MFLCRLVPWPYVTLVNTYTSANHSLPTILANVNSTRQRAASLPSARAVGSVIHVSNGIKILGVTFDSHLSLDQHVLAVCRSSYFHFRAFARALRHIRSMLTDDMAKSIAVALISSRLDYAQILLLILIKFNEFIILLLK